MATFSKDIEWLQTLHLLPSTAYFNKDKFTKTYPDVNAFWMAGAIPVFDVVSNAVLSLGYAVLAAWDAFRFVGNLLICKQEFASDAADNFVVDLRIAVALALMAPVNLIVRTLVFLSRLVSTWAAFSAPEPTEGLSTKSFSDKFYEEKKELEKSNLIVTSENYFTKQRFFSRYGSFYEFCGGLIKPLNVSLSNVFIFLSKAADAVLSLVVCVSNLLIFKPKHAQDAFSNFGVDLSLMLAHAIMAPINLIVNSLTFLTRLGTTWQYAACDVEEKSRNDRILQSF